MKWWGNYLKSCGGTYLYFSDLLPSTKSGVWLHSRPAFTRWQILGVGEW